MRIRTTRPVFWRSKTIAQLDWSTRLVLKGLESYVDDNGVGKDSGPLICADVFPYDLSREPSETIATVSRALQSLVDADLIVRYEIDGEALIYIRRWRNLQKVDSPNPGRFPRPDGTLEYKEEVDERVGAGQTTESKTPATYSRDSSENLANVSPDPRDCIATVVEEESRRVEEQKPPYPPHDEPAPNAPPASRTKNGAELARRNFAAIPARSVGAYRIAEAFSASLEIPIESGLLAGIGEQIDKCLKSSIPPPAIAEGLKAWTSSDSWSPTQIPNFVHKANNRSARNGKPTTKALGYDDALNELLEEVTTL